MLSSSLAGKLGKSSGDFTFFPPIKHVQLWPHQYVTKLDSFNMAYKDLTMPQFVFGYVECLRNSPVAQQAAMLSHLSHLMDLASSFSGQQSVLSTLMF